MAKSKKKATTGGTTTRVHVLLDRSGSMSVVWDQTISSYNEYINSLKEAGDGGTVFVSLHLFDTSSTGMMDLTTVYQDMPVGSVPPLTRETYKPRGGTPLLDAIGHVLHKIPQTIDRVALVILTDGQENQSREYKREGIKKLLDDRQQKGWLVIYLGANQDAFAEGGSFGAQAANTMSYDTSNLGPVFQSAARATSMYSRGGSSGSVAFTAEERAEALRKK